VTVQPTGLGDLAAVRRVRCADVYKGDRLAARLNRTDEGVEFAYLADYLDADGQAVATTVPLTDIPVVTAAGAVPPFFAGLLPEGRRPSSLRRAVKTSADDELSLLLAVGADPVGDVRVFPEGAVPAEAPALVTVGRSFEEVTFAEVLEAAGGVDLVALAGVAGRLDRLGRCRGRRAGISTSTPPTNTPSRPRTWRPRLRPRARHPRWRSVTSTASCASPG
jgi:HipA-like protein